MSRLSSYGDRNLQAEAMDKLRLYYDLGDDLPYVPESRGEAITLANLARTGYLSRERVEAAPSPLLRYRRLWRRPTTPLGRRPRHTKRGVTE